MNIRPVIVVGVDDSTTSRRALAWALVEAERMGGVVEVVTTYDASRGLLAQELAHTMQGSIIDEVLAEGPVVNVSSVVLPGSAVDWLTLMSGHAQLLVLGGHSVAGLRHSAEASTAEQVARLAECPVTIVPGPPVLTSQAG
jgi:nucleotide-binding universal stress UspA family protein